MRNLSFSKKGQVSNLAPAILALVFAGIILVFGIIMSQNITDTQVGSQTKTVSTNETLTLYGTGITTEITNSNDCGYETWNATKVLNCTAPTCATASNQTLIEGVDYFLNANGSLSNLTLIKGGIKVLYTSTWGGESCTAANKTTVGLGKFADFWEIIVLAIVITVVIGLLLVVFGGSRNR